ncbi:MAG: DUF4390 domain-containing protein [Gammaproteobacteria bacterium]|nr:DUF4390 domain-containing protein [Gammaproteobacteria bacterium]
MGFITPALSKPNGYKTIRLWHFVGAVLFALLNSPAYGEESFSVSNISTHLHDQVYLLDADIDFRFSDEALKALDSGVPLTISLEIQVQRNRTYWLDEDVAELEQRYQIFYHALSGQFLVQNQNSSATQIYPSLEATLFNLGHVRDLPLLDEKLIDPEEKYELELRVRLDIEALPAPLRPFAYVSEEWRLASDWYTWSLTH